MVNDKNQYIDRMLGMEFETLEATRGRCAMTVRKSDVILLEAFLKRVAPRMNPQLHWLQGQHNTSYDQPIQVKFGSNSFFCDAEELDPLVEAMDDEHCSPNQFYREVFEAFLRECADR